MHSLLHYNSQGVNHKIYFYERHENKLTSLDQQRSPIQHLLYFHKNKFNLKTAHQSSVNIYGKQCNLEINISLPPITLKNINNLPMA